MRTGIATWRVYLVCVPVNMRGSRTMVGLLSQGNRFKFVLTHGLPTTEGLFDQNWAAKVSLLTHKWILKRLPSLLSDRNGIF